MAHPYESFRANRVEKSRVKSIIKSYARGGAVKDDEAPKAASKPSAFKKSLGAIDGDKPKTRLDKFNRGGGVKKKGGAKTNVNVIVAPQSGGDKPAPVMPPMAPPMGAAPAMPPKPMAPPPMVPPGAIPPGLSPAPGMIRKDGGRTYKRGGAVKGKAAEKEMAAMEAEAKEDKAEAKQEKAAAKRDHGGRFAKGGAVKMTGGAEGGLGRLQKIAAQKRMK